MIDVDKAMLDPPGVFAHPEAVLWQATLCPSSGKAILRRWEHDAREPASVVL